MRFVGKQQNVADEPATEGEVVAIVMQALHNVSAGQSVMIGSGPPTDPIPGVGLYVDVDTGQMYRYDPEEE